MPKVYKHILVATDLSTGSDDLIERGQQIATKHDGARLSLVNVVEYTPMMYGGGEYTIPIEADLEQSLLAKANKQLIEQANRHGIPEENRWVLERSTKGEIVKLAKDTAVDLVIVGSHDKHGLAILFGSTANAMLHAMPCDILAVKLGDNDDD